MPSFDRRQDALGRAQHHHDAVARKLQAPGREGGPHRMQCGRTFLPVDERLSRKLRGRGLDKLRSIERATIEGGPSDNRLNAAAFKGPVILRGGAGNDTITGGRSGDLLVGEDGDDILRGGAGRDQLLAGPGNDRLFIKDGTRDIADAGIGWDGTSSDVSDRSRSVEYEFG